MGQVACGKALSASEVPAVVQWKLSLEPHAPEPVTIIEHSGARQVAATIPGT